MMLVQRLANVVETEPFTEEEVSTFRLPPYAVILHNDNYNSMHYVMEVLQKIFGYGKLKCMRLMLEAHKKGTAAVWIGSKELAELKADQIHACGPDPSNAQAQPLQATVEPAA